MPKLQSENLVSMTATQLSALWRSGFDGYSTPVIVRDTLRGNSPNNMFDICCTDQRSEWLINPQNEPVELTEAQLREKDEREEVCA